MGVTGIILVVIHSDNVWVGDVYGRSLSLSLSLSLCVCACVFGLDNSEAVGGSPMKFSRWIPPKLGTSLSRGLVSGRRFQFIDNFIHRKQTIEHSTNQVKLNSN